MNVVPISSLVSTFSEDLNPTDLGNARRLIAEFGLNLRYCTELKCWYVWSGCCWKPDKEKQVELWAKSVPKIIIKEATSGLKMEKELIGWALRSESAQSIRSMIELAESEPGIPLSITKFDSDLLLLGVQNGVIDLRSGEFRAPQRSDLITRQARVKFDPIAECPTWMKFIEDIFCGDEKLILFIQKLFGYVLTGSIIEQCMFVFYGSGANGKSVLLNVLRQLLGEYAKGLSTKYLMPRQVSGGPTDELARLRGTRLAIASELQEGAALDEAMIKLITGGEMIVCRGLYQNSFEYVPAFKLLLATNHKPEIRGTDHAIWRRIRLVQFKRTFSEEEQDKNLTEKLTAELPGILNWALAGHKLYQQQGLVPPKCVEEATKSYKNEMDVIGEWIDENCVKDPSIFTPLSELHGNYLAWSIANQYSYFSRRKLGDELVNRGYPRDRRAAVRGNRGIKLKEGSPG